MAHPPCLPPLRRPLVCPARPRGHLIRAVGSLVLHQQSGQTHERVQPTGQAGVHPTAARRAGGVCSLQTACLAACRTCPVLPWKRTYTPQSQQSRGYASGDGLGPGLRLPIQLPSLRLRLCGRSAGLRLRGGTQ